jgi:hypothetical protein
MLRIARGGLSVHGVTALSEMMAAAAERPAEWMCELLAAPETAQIANAAPELSWIVNNAMETTRRPSAFA